MSKRIGRRTAVLQTPPSVLSFANIGGRMEGQGPLARYFDELCSDSFFGEKTWEKAESAMQRKKAACWTGCNKIWCTTRLRQRRKLCRRRVCISFAEKFTNSCCIRRRFVLN